MTDIEAYSITKNSTNLIEFISATTGSELTVNGFKYHDCTAPMINLLQSTMYMDSLTLENVVSEDYVMTIDQA